MIREGELHLHWHHILTSQISQLGNSCKYATQHNPVHPVDVNNHEINKQNPPLSLSSLVCPPYKRWASHPQNNIPYFQSSPSPLSALCFAISLYAPTSFSTLFFLVLRSAAVLYVKPEVSVTQITAWASTVSIFHVTPSPVLTWPSGDSNIYKEVLGDKSSESCGSHPLRLKNSWIQWLSECGPLPISIFWDLVKHISSQAPSQTCRTRNTGGVF